MADNPNINLPPIPEGADDKMKEYLTSLTRTLQDKQVNDYNTIKGLSGTSDQSYVKQIVQKHVTDPYTYAYTATRASAVELACLTTQITTTSLDTKIMFDALICGEILHDGAFILERVINGVATEIGSPSPVGSRFYGIVVPEYDPDNASTMNQNKIQYIDSPNVPSGTIITYRLKMYGPAGYYAYINRTTSDLDTWNYERATSNVRLTEFSGTAIIQTETTDIASVVEAQTGTNDTKVVTPLKLRNALNANGSAPVYACRAWVNFNGTGTVAIRGSGNVSSITDHAVGQYTVNFITPMEDSNYSTSLGNREANDPNENAYNVRVAYTTGQLAESVRLSYGYYTTVNTYGDANSIYVAVFR